MIPSLHFNDPLILTINNFFDHETCNSLIDLTESTGYTPAPVSIDGNAGIFEMMPDYRNNTRVIVDDPKLSNELFEKVKQYLPQTFRGWGLEGINERFRFYKYEPGQEFKIHMDGHYQRNIDSKSCLTLLIYLSDDCTGGETSFYTEEEDKFFTVTPEKGSLLLFQHRVLHAGEPVVSGTKYVLRTDVMYKRPVY